MPTDTRIRHVDRADAAAEAMRRALWPDGADDHASEIAAFFESTLDEPVAVLMATTSSNAIVGFIELSLRGDIPGWIGDRLIMGRRL